MLSSELWNNILIWFHYSACSMLVRMILWSGKNQWLRREDTSSNSERMGSIAQVEQWVLGLSDSKYIHHPFKTYFTEWCLYPSTILSTGDIPSRFCFCFYLNLFPLFALLHQFPGLVYERIWGHLFTLSFSLAAFLKWTIKKWILTYYSQERIF